MEATLGLEDLASFVTAAEAGSLTGAARTLGVPKSTVSRRLARLEEDLGHTLVMRSSRTFRLTEVGEALYRRSAPALLDLGQAVDAARDAGSQPAGELRITAPVDLGSSLPFASAMVRFSAAWPGIRLTVDLSDRLVDVVAEGIDVACRLHAGPLEDRATLVARRLRQVEMGLFAARAYLDRAGRPSSVADLADHALVRIERPGGSSPWPLLEGLPQLDARASRARGTSTTSMSFGAAAIAAGGGIGLLPALVAEALPGVERVLIDVRMTSPTLSLVWPASRQLSPRVRAFVDFMVETIGG